MVGRSTGSSAAETTTRGGRSPPTPPKAIHVRWFVSNADNKSGEYATCTHVDLFVAGRGTTQGALCTRPTPFVGKRLVRPTGEVHVVVSFFHLADPVGRLEPAREMLLL